MRFIGLSSIFSFVVSLNSELSGDSLVLTPPFSVLFALLKVLVPVFALGGRSGRHCVAFLSVLRPELRPGLMSWSVRVQAQDDPLQVGILPQVGVQRALAEAAQGHGIAPYLPVQGAEKRAPIKAQRSGFDGKRNGA